MQKPLLSKSLWGYFLARPIYLGQFIRVTIDHPRNVQVVSYHSPQRKISCRPWGWGFFLLHQPLPFIYGIHHESMKMGATFSFTLTSANADQFKIVKKNCRKKQIIQRKQRRIKQALRETQTLRAGCSKAEPKNFAPPQTPFPGARDGQNLISWDGHCLHLQTQFGEDRWVSNYRGNRPTSPETNTQTDRTDYNTLRR